MVKNPCQCRGTGSIPGPGGFHVPQATKPHPTHTEACVPQSRALQKRSRQRGTAHHTYRAALLAATRERPRAALCTQRRKNIQTKAALRKPQDPHAHRQTSEALWALLQTTPRGEYQNKVSHTHFLVSQCINSYTFICAHSTADYEACHSIMPQKVDGYSFIKNTLWLKNANHHQRCQYVIIFLQL